MFNKPKGSDRMKELSNLQSIAAALYDGGWRSKDKECIVEEYGLSESDAETVCALLEKYEKGSDTE